MNKQIIYFGGFLIIVAVGVYFYFSKPVAVPTNSNINSEIVPVENIKSTEQFAKGEEKNMTIQQDNSTAEFRINELLRGEPKLVIGTTNQIAGQIIVEESGENTMITVGEVKVNARTLKTDSDQRNGALARTILKSEDSANEFIAFKPQTTITVPTTKVSSDFNFTITGDLTIKGITKSATFNGSGKIIDNIFSGTAQTIVAYTNYGISIPSLPFIADVDPTTTLIVNFVAK